MKIISLDKVSKAKAEMEGADKLYKQVPIGGSDGSPAFCFRVLTIEPNGHTPYHEHPFEHLNYVIEGNGAVVTATGEQREIKTGDFALVLPNEKHQYRNNSSAEALVMICAVPNEYE